MGCGGSKPEPEPQYPEDGKKLRRDTTLEEVYELGPVLGEGGYSRVKLVTHHETGVQYACKIIPLPRPGRRAEGDDTPDRAGIMAEIDALLDLEHPNIVGLHEYFVSANKVYLIMELLRGGALLEAVVEKGQYGEADARTVFRQLISAVQYLHSRGVVHRDVKLDNLLLVEPGDLSQIKLADFGFAKKLHGGVPAAMQTVCGTQGYIAPEVIQVVLSHSGNPRSDWEKKQRHYGPPCDLWSAGIVLYMLLAGSPPFYDQSEPRLLRRIMAGQFEFDASIWKPVSAAAKDLIRKLLVVDPAKRLTCEQVLQHPWMTSGGRTSAHLPESLAAIKKELTRRRSSQQSTLQQRISDALRESGSAGTSRAGSLAVTPAGGSPTATSPTAAALPANAALGRAWSGAARHNSSSSSSSMAQQQQRTGTLGGSP